MTLVDDLVFEHKPEETTTDTTTTPEEWVAWFGPYLDKPKGRPGYGLDFSAFRTCRVGIRKTSGGKYQTELLLTPGIPCGPCEESDILEEAKEKGKKMIR